MKNLFNTVLLLIFCGLILTLSIRGIPGNPNDSTLNKTYWTEDGPLELSPERGKFALTYSIIENNSFKFSIPLARLATPDLGFHNGEYVSLFPPGVSFLTIPGYILGREFGVSQVGAYSVIAIFALINVYFIRAILLKLGVNNLISSLSATTFLFATTAFTYAVSLYQHHISTSIILSSIYLLVRFKIAWSLLVIWFLLAVSLVVDSPNLFLMFPIGIYALGRLIYLKVTEDKVKIGVNILGSLTILIALIPLIFFGWFNKASYGDPLQLGGTVSTVKALDDQGRPAKPQDSGTENSENLINPDKQEKDAVNFFLTRNLLNGFYIHLFSPDRGVLHYAPVILLGILGFAPLYKKNGPLSALLVSVIGVNVLLYSMWGDPWGGWAFGSRYLIPTYAMLAIFLGFALMNMNRYFLFPLIFLVMFIYSVGVNTVGAITSNRNPPQIEVLGLEKLSGMEQKYTFDRNFDMLDLNKSKAFIFNLLGYKYLTAWHYYFILVALIVLPGAGMLTADQLIRKRSK